LTVFGDGRQVRDVLHVADLLSLYDRARRRPKSSSGQIFNAGGGPGSTLSLRELLSWLEVRLNRKIPVTHAGWRPGDQKVYVSDISKARMRLGWEPTTSIDTGLERLLAWLSPRFSAS
jgi:CDP-paratose 2-epimerase